MRYDVYEDSDGSTLYSKGVTRDFGVNKVINLCGGGQEFCSVQPLKVAPSQCEIKKIGYINANPFTD